jgi:outer membrane lipoprotein-sorting protein
MKQVTMALVLLFCMQQLSHPIDVQELLEASDLVMHPENLQGTFRMILISPRGNERAMEVEAYQRRQSETREDRLFVFTHPPSVAGTGLLVHSYRDDEDRMWIYLPAVDMLKRVNLSTSGGGYFMGSDFTYSDLISAPRQEFTFELLGEAEVDGEPCFLVSKQGRSRAVERQYGYSLEEHYIRKSDLVTVRIVFYDLAGDLLKELRVQEVQIIGPYRYPSDVIMENMQTGHRSEIVFGDIQVPEIIPDEFFTHRYLQNR